MPAPLPLEQTTCQHAASPFGSWTCQMCDCYGEGCDGTVCHGFDTD